MGVNEAVLYPGYRTLSMRVLKLIKLHWKKVIFLYDSF